MADRTTSTHRALLTHDPRFGAAAIAANGVSGADYTTAGPIPGRPVPAAGTLADLQASGSQGTRTVEVYTTRGGNPGAAVALVDGSYLAPTGVAWRYEGDTFYRGWDPPTTISEFEFLDRTTTANKYLDPHVVTTTAGDSYLVVQLSERYVQCWSRPLGGQWSAVGTVYDAASAVYAAPVAAIPCLVVLPDGTLLCLYWDGVGSGIYSSTSADSGVTWSRGQLVEGVLLALGLPMNRIRAAYSNGQILMLVSYQGAFDSVVQFASTDQGQSFTLVSTLVDRQAGYAEVVAAPSGSGFVVATIETNLPSTGVPAPATLAYVRRVGSAFDFVMTATPVLVQTDTSTVTWGTQAAGVLTAGELALTVDDAGVLWLVGLAWSVTREGIVRCSTDGGATWLGVGGAWYDCNDATRGPRQLTVSAQGGRLILPHTLNASTATASLACSYLGGPTTVARPQQTSVITLPEFAKSWTVDWLPYALPEATGATWTFASAGAPTITLTNQGVHIVHGGVLDYATWTATPVTSDAQGLLVGADLKAVAGAIELTVQIATTYTAKLTVTPTAITVTDVGGAVVRATTTTTAGASGVQVLIAVGDDGSGGRFRAWYRPWGSGADREWTVLIGLSSALTVAAASADAVVFGTGAGTATTDAYARLTHYAAGTDAGGTGCRLYASAAQPNPTGLLGQAISPLPYPCAESGVRLSMRSGPTRPGDTWTIAPSYRYPVSNIDPRTAASPSARWRNLAHNVNQRLVFVMAEATPMESPLAGVHVEGNIATASWMGWDGAAWVLIAAVDLRLGTALKYTRAGEIVYCGTGGGSAISDYIERGALRGCTFVSSGGTVRRRIARNTGGRWTGAAVTTTRPILTLTAPDAGDPTAASDAEIVSPRGTCVFRGATTAYSRYSLYIPAQLTAEGYYELGVVMPGPLAVLGSPDWSRQLSTATNVETTETRQGVQTKRRLGAPPRSATIAWTDGWDSSNTHDAAPDYVTDYTGGTPIATPAGIASDVHGLVYDNDATPVVYLPVVPVPAGAATVTNITAADLLLYGHIDTDTIQTDVVLGTEHQGKGTGELVRVGSVRMRECL